jgi:hypothetical protein
MIHSIDSINLLLKMGSDIMKTQFLKASVCAFAMVAAASAHQALAQIVNVPQVPLSDTNCRSPGPITVPPCTTLGTRTVSTPTIISTPGTTAGTSNVAISENVTYSGNLSIDGLPFSRNTAIGSFSFDPSFPLGAAQVNVTSDYLGTLSFRNVPNAIVPSLSAFYAANPLGFFSNINFNSNTVNSINVDLVDTSATDIATGREYLFSLATPNPTNIVGGNSTALVGKFQNDPSSSGGIVFGTLSGNATLLSQSGPALITPATFGSSPIDPATGLPIGAWASPYALQYNVVETVTTTLDETGLITPKIAVTNGINMNGSLITNLGAGVAAGDAVNKAQLDAEAAARTARDAALTAALATEATTRAAADTALAGQITSEANTRALADTALGARITTETTTRAAAVVALNQRVDTEVTARSAADTAFAGQITSEASARALADTAFATRLDSFTAKVNALDGRITALDRRVSSSTATAVAMGGAAFLPDMKFNLTANVATYDGAQAGSIQFGALVSPHVALNAGAAKSFNKGGKTAARAGVTFGW